MPFATTSAGQIRFTVSGATDATENSQTLLMIGGGGQIGGGGSSALWWRLLPLVARRHRVIVFDHRGTGGSSPAQRGLTMADMVDDALAVLDAAGVENAHVMGASMGGMVAQHLALDHRDRVRSLALVGTTAGGRREAPNLRLTAALILGPLVGGSRTFPILAPVFYSQRTRRHERQRLKEDMRIRSSDRVGARTPFLQAAAVLGHDTRARLHELVGVPTLVIHGLEDRPISPERGRELARLIPGARLVEIPHAGHVLETEAEDRVAAAVVDHVERHTGVGRGHTLR
jgi:pimeloyl-ACP methyl ester carboxylesterase